VAGRGGVVASGHPAVSAAGVDILRRGGNAVDAAVGAFFTSFHAEPTLGSAAGGGFMVARVDGEDRAWDFFSTAPGLGRGGDTFVPRPDAFFGIEVDFGSATQVFHVGAGSIAVPGALAGLCTAQREAGRLPLSGVLEPAMAVCAEGSAIRTFGAAAMRLLEPIVRSRPEFLKFFAGPDGALLGPDDRYRNPDLGRFYAELARSGGDLWHGGPLTDFVVNVVQQAGGGLTRDDLVSYRVERSVPIEVDLADGTRLALCPPASSGGMLVAYGALLLDGFDAPAVGSRDDLLLLRAVMAETQHARAEVVGGDTPSMGHVERLLHPDTVAAGRRRVRRLLEHGVGPLPDAPTDRLGSTTHISAIDRDGNACAVTVSNGECSGNVLPGYGVFFNNFLGEEDINPKGFHRLPPGTRMGSAMTPMLVEHPGGALTALGTGGSSRIRSALLQVSRNLCVHGMTPAQAVVADRVHYENGTLYAEAAGAHAAAMQGLASEGLDVSIFGKPSMYFGGSHLVRRDADGTSVGVADARRAGEAASEDP